MERLIGKKVWVVQYDDEDDSVLGYFEGVSNDFVVVRLEGEGEPSLYINLVNVREIEVFRPKGEGEVRFLRTVPPKDTEKESDGDGVSA